MRSPAMWLACAGALLLVPWVEAGCFGGWDLSSDPSHDDWGDEGECQVNWDCPSGEVCLNTGWGQWECGAPLHEGASCGNSSQCESSLVCSFDPSHGRSECRERGGPGDDCEDVSDCQAGLVCVGPDWEWGTCQEPLKPGECFNHSDCDVGQTCWDDGDGAGFCAFSGIGDPCDDHFLCESGLACAVWGNTYRCLEVTMYEGGGCKENYFENDTGTCAEGMYCVCGGGTCACYDGSAGDPCEHDLGWAGCDGSLGLQCVHNGGATGVCSAGFEGDPCDQDTCGVGLQCVMMDEQENQACFDGTKGDPCATDADCLEPLVCRDVVGAGHCVALLAAGSKCDGTEPFAACESDGMCQEWDGAKYCFGPLGLAAPCQPGSLVAWCDVGLVCSLANDIPRCLVPSGSGGACVVDSDCQPGLVCVDDPGHCYSGGDGQPCVEPSDCAAGYSCNLQALKCFNGNTGDSCASDTDCQEGYQCDEKYKQCFMDGHGRPCTESKDCPADLGCVAVGLQYVCFEYLDEGQACGPLEIPFSACGLGLACDVTLEEPVCTKAPL